MAYTTFLTNWNSANFFQIFMQQANLIVKVTCLRNVNGDADLM
jgi:hypothetical protein